MISRLHEFFEGDDHRLSMSRLLCFMSFFPASYVVIRNYDSLQVPEILAVYLGAFVLGYVGGKTADIWMKPKEPADADTKSDS